MQEIVEEDGEDGVRMGMEDGEGEEEKQRSKGEKFSDELEVELPGLLAWDGMSGVDLRAT